MGFVGTEKNSEGGERVREKRRELGRRERKVRAEREREVKAERG